MSARPLALALLASLAAACNVGGPVARRGHDAGVAPWTDAGVVPCAPTTPCPDGLVCTDGLCIAPRPDETCGPCPAPGECRMGRCIQPDPSGEICEFDDACGLGVLCIGAHCTPDPRVPVPCGPLGECAGGLTCLGDRCGCAFTVDCPSGTECVAGTCASTGGCLADADCGGAWVCEAGVCVDRAVCEAVDPDLSGVWEMSSTLRLREALPSWLSGLLDAVEGPFRYLSGDGPCFDLGGFGFLEGAVCALVAPVRDSLPAWARSLLGAIAELNVVLSTWHVNERMELVPTGTPDVYAGTHTWTRVRFVSRSTAIEVDPRTLFDWRFEPDPFSASASCGTLTLSRHEIDFSIGAVIVWLVNAVIEESTDGAYRDLGSAARAVTDGFCRALADAAATSVDSRLAPVVRAACDAEIGDAIDGAVRAIETARLEVSPLTLRGHATIEGPRSLRPGRWDGTLLGSDFTGDWEAWR
jgi:hypothetical protein